MFTNEFFTNDAFIMEFRFIVHPVKATLLIYKCWSWLKLKYEDGLHKTDAVVTALIVKELVLDAESRELRWCSPGWSSSVILVQELKLELAMYCCKVRQGSSLTSPGQGVSSEGMMLSLIQLTYCTALCKRINMVSKTLLSISIYWHLTIIIIKSCNSFLSYESPMTLQDCIYWVSVKRLLWDNWCDLLI